MNLSPSSLRSAIRPLRFIFWGGLICLFDFTLSETKNGRGLKVDIFNDLAGMLMITWAVFQPASIPVNGLYRKAMFFVQVVSVLGCLDALHAHFIYRVPAFLSFCHALVNLASLAATVVFCLSMRTLSLAAGLRHSGASWGKTTGLFVFIHVIPLGLVYSAGLVAILIGEKFYFNLGVAGLLLLPVFAAPLVHLFISTSRMKEEAKVSLAQLEERPA